jgi:hypothetical protein
MLGKVIHNEWNGVKGRPYPLTRRAGGAPQCGACR